MLNNTNFTQQFFQTHQSNPVPGSMEEAILQFKEGIDFGEAARTIQDIHNMAMSSAVFLELEDHQKSSLSSEVLQIQRLLYYMSVFM